jgi:hypothetical protein
VRRAALRPGSLRAFALALWKLGVVGPRRRHFWRLLATALPRGAAAVPRAVTLAVLGEHFVGYTAEEVLPRLDRRIVEVRAETARAARRARFDGRPAEEAAEPAAGFREEHPHAAP